MRDHKLVWLTQFVDVALLVHLVGLLVVDKQVGGTLACHPLVEHSLVGLLLEGLLHKFKLLGAVSYVGEGIRTHSGANLHRNRKPAAQSCFVDFYLLLDILEA